MTELSARLQKELEHAQSIEDKDAPQAIKVYHTIVFSNEQAQNEEANKIKEQGIYKLGRLLAKQGKGAELSQLSKDIRPFFDSVSKAKTAKIVRTLIDLVADIPNSTDLQITLCKESIEWAKQTKRTFLRQRIETRLASLYIDAKQYQAALDLITGLLREVKKLDDKLLLVEIHLIECRIHHALKNIPRAKAALVSARSNANAIYCPPALQTQLDLQSGVLHTEERDYKTAYSYFFESFEGSSSMEDSKAIVSLKYMLLSKIMSNHVEDVYAIISGKLALKYAGRDIEAMRAVANAHKERSLENFELAKKNYAQELTNDPLIHSHLTELYDTLLEQNLCRILEPFSVVEIAHVAKLIKLPVPLIEKKLSQMILDKKFNGILDQGLGQFIVYDEVSQDKTYAGALTTVENMSKVVDSLYQRTNKIFA